MSINALFRSLPVWTIEEQTGYKPITTYWQDFSIADACQLRGLQDDAILDTHQRCWPGLKKSRDPKTITEYVMVLNWKIWAHYENGAISISRIYDRLWRECESWVFDNLKDDDLQYYLNITD